MYHTEVIFIEYYEGNHHRAKVSLQQGKENNLPEIVSMQLFVVLLIIGRRNWEDLFIYFLCLPLTENFWR